MLCARVWADYRKYHREFGNVLSLDEFAKLICGRHQAKLKQFVRCT